MLSVNAQCMVCAILAQAVLQVNGLRSEASHSTAFNTSFPDTNSVAGKGAPLRVDEQQWVFQADRGDVASMFCNNESGAALHNQTSPMEIRCTSCRHGILVFRICGWASAE